MMHNRVTMVKDEDIKLQCNGPKCFYDTPPQVMSDH